MKSAQLTAIGAAESVVKCIDVPDPGAPGEGEVLVDIVACSINPADILMIEGKYATVPETPCALGIEGAGIVKAVGPGVDPSRVGEQRAPRVAKAEAGWYRGDLHAHSIHYRAW